jgi:hypothetical protein
MARLVASVAALRPAPYQHKRNQAKGIHELKLRAADAEYIVMARCRRKRLTDTLRRINSARLALRIAWQADSVTQAILFLAR